VKAVARQLRGRDVVPDLARVYALSRSKYLTPLTDAAYQALADARSRAKAIGDAWVSPNERGDGPRERHWFRAWWLRAEKLAELEHDGRWGYSAPGFPGRAIGSVLRGSGDGSDDGEGRENGGGTMPACRIWSGVAERTLFT